MASSPTARRRPARVSPPDTPAEAGDPPVLVDDRHCYLALAAAYVRGRLPKVAEDDEAAIDDAAAVAQGRAAGLRLARFKRNAELPRVRAVLGILRALSPASLLDLGSGRGTFLWPLLDAFPGLPVIAGDRDPGRAARLDAVRRGGWPGLAACALDATALPLPDRAVDIVTALEVLEHLERPEAAAAEALRVAGRYVVASVPSHPDRNPEHLRLFTPASLSAPFTAAGARRIAISHVPNHMIAVVTVP